MIFFLLIPLDYRFIVEPVGLSCRLTDIQIQYFKPELHEKKENRKEKEMNEEERRKKKEKKNHSVKKLGEGGEIVLWELNDPTLIM